MSRILTTRSIPAVSGFVLAAGMMFSGAVAAQTSLESDAQKSGYSLGANIGTSLSGQGVLSDVDTEALIAGLRDSISGNLQMTEEDMIAALQALQAAQQAKAQAELQAKAAQGQEFLAQNGQRDGVMTTESGLQYEVLSDAGSGTSPGAEDTVEVHYHGTLVDGTVFDSSVDRGEPISFPVNGVIPGWTEGLQLMQVGDKYRFVIPPELGYGANPVGPIPANSVLVFEVELLSVAE